MTIKHLDVSRNLVGRDRRHLATLIAVSLLAANTSMGATSFFKTGVSQTSALEESLGGCHAKLEVLPSEKGLVCNGPWVHFSCNGAINSREEGVMKYSAAQLALISGTPIRIRVDDDPAKMINGKCYAVRVENMAE